MIKILLPLLLASNLWAQEKPIAKSFMDFSGGLNNYAPAIYLAPNESPDLMNVEIDNPVGILKQRSGYFSCGTTPSGNTATAMAEYAKSDGSRALIVTDNATVWQTFDCVTFSTITTGLSSLDTPSFKTIRDKLWIVNGSTYPVTWDGSTATSLDGSGAKPLAPKARYIEFWKERVWLANTATDPSVVYFSDLTDDEGTIIDPSISSAAWSNALNTFYISREDGSPLYGLRAYRDNLYCLKYTGLWKIIYESDFNTAITKSVASTGSQFNSTLVEMDDGLLYFIGRDGVYAFDGINATRISDKWQSTFDRLKQPFGRERFKIWDAPVDFLAGSLSNTSTNYISGSISLGFETSSRTFDTFSDLSKWTVGEGTAGYSISSGKLIYDPTIITGAVGSIFTSTKTLNWGNWQIDLNASAYNDGITGPTGPSRMDYYFVSSSSSPSITSGYLISDDCTSGATLCKIKIKKVSNGTESVVGEKVCDSQGGAVNRCLCNGLKINVSQYGVFTISTSTYSGTAACDLTATDPEFVFGGSSYNIIRNYDNFGATTVRALYLPYIYVDNLFLTGNFSPSGSFTSEAYNVGTALTQWRTFSADNTLNGQSIVYSIRKATASYNLGLASYDTIRDGDIISTDTTKQLVQWKANFTTYDNSQTPIINSVSINWREGDASVSPLSAISYKNRYWLIGSTTASNNYNDIVMVKSKSPLNSWMRHDLPLSALTLWNGNLYGAISNTGQIARLDYGDNDNGSAITSYWQSKDETFSNPVNYKTLNQIIVDYAKSVTNNTMAIATSYDSGSTWQSRTLDMTAGKYPRNTKILNYDTPQALNYRMRVYNNKLDSNYVIYGLHALGGDTSYVGK